MDCCLSLFALENISLKMNRFIWLTDLGPGKSQSMLLASSEGHRVVYNKVEGITW